MFAQSLKCFDDSADDILTAIDEGLVAVFEVNAVGGLRTRPAVLVPVRVPRPDLLGARLALRWQVGVARVVPALLEQVVHVLVLFSLEGTPGKFVRLLALKLCSKSSETGR